MSIRNSLLAILGERAFYGYELRQEFEARTGAAWPLNIGQVYTTLDRLQRDGQIDSAGEDTDGRRLWQITEAGRRECDRWLSAPIEQVERGRDALAMKLAIASTLPRSDIASIIQAQREATTRALQDLTRTKAAGGDTVTPSELAWLLVVDSMIFQAEAEIRWLDHSEQRLSKLAADRATSRQLDSLAAHSAVAEETQKPKKRAVR
ncbi:MAG TPA: PadR family transcriptional regulator [Galbitalea sp.]|nr:PadR family transcriptional regulator [Galbitalea sp.]